MAPVGPRKPDQQIIRMIEAQEAGMATAELCRRHGLSPATFYKRKVSCCRFRGHEDKIVTKETEIGHGKTEAHEGVQV